MDECMVLLFSQQTGANVVKVARGGAASSYDQEGIQVWRCQIKVLILV
jgi:hypothetical protein